MADRNLNPRGPNKFEPTTTAKPAPNATPGRTTAVEKRRAKEEEARRRRERDDDSDT